MIIPAMNPSSKCRKNRNLSGLSIGSAGEYGLFVGTGQGTSDTWLKASTAGVRLVNVGLEEYSGGTKVIGIDGTSGIQLAMGADPYTYEALRGLSWYDGATRVGTLITSGTGLNAADRTMQIKVVGPSAGERGRLWLQAAGQAGSSVELGAAGGASPGVFVEMNNTNRNDPYIKLYFEDEGGISAWNNVLINNAGTSFGKRLFAPAGTQALPAYSFSDDPDTGFYRAGDGWVRVVRNGVATFDFGTLNVSTVNFQVIGNANLLTLTGTDHAYVAFYPRGSGAGRKAYMGFGGASTTNFSLMNEDTGGLYMQTNGNGNQLVLLPGGNVGVGNATGSEKLHVSGNVLAQAYYATSDPGSGVAGRVALVNASNWTIGSGTGTVKMTGSTARTNAAWLKVYVGDQTCYIPVWTNIS